MVSTAVVVAATIEYEIVARPANLQADFTAPLDADLRFLAIKITYGSRVGILKTTTHQVEKARLR
jgi:hypothetical protein